MQLAGVSCVICKKNVLFDSDATWCARCSSVMHSTCLATASDMCPVCHKAYDQPESHFVFSEQCPECFRPNNPTRPQCGSCSARTRWDTQAAYEDFLAYMKNGSRIRFLRGVLEMVLGILCLVTIVVLLLVGFLPIIPMGALLFGFMTLLADGWWSLLRSRRMAIFR